MQRAIVPVKAVARIRQSPLPLMGAFLALVLLVLQGCTSSAPATSEQAPQSTDGRQAPAFALPAADGGTVALDDYVGRQPVLLYFHMAVG